MRRESLVAIVTALAVAGVSAPADAVVLCVKKSGALFLREACKREGDASETRNVAPCRPARRAGSFPSRQLHRRA